MKAITSTYANIRIKHAWHTVVGTGCVAYVAAGTRVIHCCSLQEYVPQEKLAEVRRVLHGFNCGGLVPQLQLPEKLCAAAAAEHVDLQVL